MHLRPPLLDLVVACLAGVACCSCGKDGGTPRILDPQDVETFDAGTVQVEDLPEERVSHQFTIYNSSSDDLLITKTERSCGCVQAQLSSMDAKPGQAITMNMKLDVSGKTGPVSAEVSLQGKASKHLRSYRIQCVVKRSLTLKPRDLNFGQVRHAQSKALVAGIQLPKGYQIVEMKGAGWASVHEGISVEGAEGTAKELVIQLAPPMSAPLGVAQGSYEITVRGPRGNMHKMTGGVVFEVTVGVVVEPATLRLSTSEWTPFIVRPTTADSQGGSDDLQWHLPEGIELRTIAQAHDRGQFELKARRGGPSLTSVSLTAWGEKLQIPTVILASK